MAILGIWITKFTTRFSCCTPECWVRFNMKIQKSTLRFWGSSLRFTRTCWQVKLNIANSTCNTHSWSRLTWMLLSSTWASKSTQMHSLCSKGWKPCKRKCTDPITLSCFSYSSKSVLVISELDRVKMPGSTLMNVFSSSSLFLKQRMKPSSKKISRNWVTCTKACTWHMWLTATTKKLLKVLIRTWKSKKLSQVLNQTNWPQNITKEPTPWSTYTKERKQ